MSDFDKWFDDNVYDEQHRVMFEKVWDSAIDQLIQTNKELEEKLESRIAQVKELGEKADSLDTQKRQLEAEVKTLKADMNIIFNGFHDAEEFLAEVKGEAIEQGEEQ